ncbi:TIGR04211 family SH3 domain-containing protein [Fundidesulfovibrio terrae]|uniref:TIGR04211 family SH3 domain-containing protein n=1 Tax=Fundidesulfovibrio terrae TaxID=2922866 RepID=UPI001FAFA433|nr:TIGR04211 family SH3 domain-containing protein [Fundidesulfovibrio terrae]
MRILRYIAALAALLFLPSLALAQQLFVSDVQEITLRTGPSLDNKIVQMVKSGAKLEKLKEEGEWAQVRTDTGKEGWVLKRYLSSETPTKVQFEDFKSRNAEMIEKAGKVESIVGKFEEENKGLQKTLASTQAELSRIKTEYETLSKANANVAEMTRSFHDMKAASEAAKQEMDRIKRENETLRDISDVKWFLAGAGVFFGGWIFGYLLGRAARKKSNRMYL